MHFASELVASVEFAALFEGFCAHFLAYGFSSEADDAMAFVRIHTTVEPLHLGQNCELIKVGLTDGIISPSEIVSAATRYLDQFGRVYSELNRVIFRTRV
jgi:hypothetical protein